jgi:hypothetical protein
LIYRFGLSPFTILVTIPLLELLTYLPLLDTTLLIYRFGGRYVNNSRRGIVTSIVGGYLLTTKISLTFWRKLNRHCLWNVCDILLGHASPFLTMILLHISSEIDEICCNSSYIGVNWWRFYKAQTDKLHSPVNLWTTRNKLQKASYTELLHWVKCIFLTMTAYLQTFRRYIS